MAESAPSEQWNLVTLEIGAGPGVNTSRIVLHITLLWSFNLHKHPVLSFETFRCLEFGTCRHSREIWFQIRRPANQIYNQAWLSEFLDFGIRWPSKSKICSYTAAKSLSFAQFKLWWPSELAAIWPKMICRRVDKLDLSTSHPCFKNRICQICRNKFITYIILDFRLYLTSDFRSWAEKVQMTTMARCDVHT